jgi:tetratricopeptide (TPR) repeat protein
MIRFAVLAVASSVLLGMSPPARAHEKTPPPAEVVGDLGETTFANSGAQAAQPDFLRGLLLLHSFEYDAARRSFRAALDEDPGFYMAFWGEAMTHNHPIWGEQDLQAGRAVLARLGPDREARLAKAPTSREQGYFAALEALYGEGEKGERDARYNEALGQLAARHPDDLDARAFYALSWLGLTGAVRDTANYMRAAAEAESIYEVNKRHPGALHYLVHAYDDPVHAPLGLRAARLYGKVAPAASHAQHMPSHIFFALGMWDDAIEANIASLATARSQGHGGYHALEWLAYAWLQQGNREEAAKLVRIVEQDVMKGPTQANRTSLAFVRAMWLAETGGGAEVDAWPGVDEAGIASTYSFTAHDFARGVTAARNGDVARARELLGQMRLRNAAARERIVGVVSSSYDTVTPEEAEQGSLLATALEGAILFSEGQQEAGIARVREAIATADTLPFEYGPPYSAKPLEELLGDLLLAVDRPGEAAVAYQQCLATRPNRRLSTQGLTAARAAAWACQHCRPGAAEAAAGS